MSKTAKYILPIIVIAQFCCTSLWFAGNAILEDLIITYNLNTNILGSLTSVVQFGFILGTLSFAVLTIADRFSPSKVFFVSAILGALANLSIINSQNTYISILLFRFLTGFFLAGIYPVGMKIAADYFEKGLGKALGFLVGALVLGTAFPHLLKDTISNFNWRIILIVISATAILGGFLILLFVPNGPYRKQSQKLQIFAFAKVFEKKEFKGAAFGYFGHMWELYTFWAFVPVMLLTFKNKFEIEYLNVSFLSFLIIGVGCLGCFISGFISQKIGLKKIAFFSLLISGICCLLAPIILNFASLSILIVFLVFWGFFVISDSPMFSSLVAHNTSPKLKGTALTIVNCIGFAITILSIQLVNYLHVNFSSNLIFLVLVIGPIFGLVSLRGVKSTQ